MRVVLDTNILLSALIAPGGTPDQLYQAWREGRFSLVTSEEQLEEFRRVTRYPRIRAYLEPSSAGTMLNEIRQLSVLVEKLPRLQICRDPADNFLLALAEVSKAQYLVTGDKRDILKLRHHKTTKIVSARTFVELLE